METLGKTLLVFAIMLAVADRPPALADRDQSGRRATS